MDRIESPIELLRWLETKPRDWAQIVAVRIALRVFPYMAAAEELPRSGTLAIATFRATAIAWSARSIPAFEVNVAAREAAAAVDVAKSKLRSATASSAVAEAAASAARASRVDSATNAAATAAGAARAALRCAVSDRSVWAPIERDCAWLLSQSDQNKSAEILARRPLWLGSQHDGWLRDWIETATRLGNSDPTYKVWFHWFERRIRGEAAAFEILGDKLRKEDIWLLRKIANANDYGFWERGAEYVNQQLAEWLAEARERAAKNLEPLKYAKAENPDFHIPPEPGVRLYGFNQGGLLDRLPASQQDQLRDSPNQRRSYQHIRDDLMDLLAEGQKLGRKLQELLERALADFPEDFAEAEADIIWRHIGKLRRAYRKHLAAPKPPELDDHRLDPQIAIDLGGLLDGMNNFVLGDHGLLRRQEDAVDPQLRSDRKEEAKAAEPLAQATIASEGVVTRTVKQDIAQGSADLEAALPSADSGDRSADAEVDSINRERRNIFGGLLTGAKDTLKDARSGAAKEAGKQSLDFITKNSQTIIDYVRKAFSQETAEAIVKWIGSLFP